MPAVPPPRPRARARRRRPRLAAPRSAPVRCALWRPGEVTSTSTRSAPSLRARRSSRWAVCRTSRSFCRETAPSRSISSPRPSCTRSSRTATSPPSARRSATRSRSVFAPTSTTATRTLGILTTASAVPRARSFNRCGRASSGGVPSRACSASAASAPPSRARPSSAGRAAQRPSGPSSQACVVAWRSTSKTRSISRCARASSTGATSSIRWSRLRGIRSALPRK